MERREFLSSACALVGAALCPVVAQAVAAVQAGIAPGARGAQILAGPERELLVLLVDGIIPPTDTSGAAAAGVADFVQFMLTHGFTPAQFQDFAGGVSQVQRVSGERFGKPYRALDESERHAVLLAVQAQPATAAFFAALRDLTIIGYYTSEMGASKELRYLPVPGEFTGCMPIAPSERAFFDSNPLDRATYVYRS